MAYDQNLTEVEIDLPCATAHLNNASSTPTIVVAAKPRPCYVSYALFILFLFFFHNKTIFPSFCVSDGVWQGGMMFSFRLSSYSPFLLFFL
jgi:hypothetical protein